MKTIVISFLALCLFAFLIIAFLPNGAKPTNLEIETLEETLNQRAALKKKELEAMPSYKEGAIPLDTNEELPVKQQMEFILTNAHVGSDKYLLLLKLLGTHEDEVLAYLAERRYSYDMAIEGPEYAEVEMIGRSMIEFYMHKPLANNLEKVEILRETGPLFSNVVSDLLFAGEGVESADAAYKWVMNNPEHPASLRSGATIGTIMNTFTPEVAWEKAIELPHGSIRERAFNSIIAESTKGDMNAAIDLINSVEVTPDMDPAISNVLNMGINSGHPYSDLVDLAAAPVDPAYRSSSLVVLFQNWAANDLQSMLEWSDQEHEFPPEQMEEINLIMKQTIGRHQTDF